MRSTVAAAPVAAPALAGTGRATTALVLVLLIAPACVWRSYADVMRVHLDVLSGLAEKAAFNAGRGRRPSSNDVTELTYPLQRARQFAYQYRSYADRESYRLFEVALDRYQAFAEAIDGARGDQARWAAERATVEARHRAWVAAAADARAALDRGS
jgi:hypothetical protein